MIREGTVQDIAEIATLCVQMHLESEYSTIPRNDSKGADFLVHAICAPEYSVLVAEDASGIHGVHIGFVQDLWFSDELLGYDVLLYISPNKRGGMSGIRLIKAFETWTFSKGAIEIRPGSTTGISPDRVRALHERLGYRTVGYTFRKVK